MDYYNKDIDETLKNLSSKIEGLTKEEVLKRRKANGLNEITEKNKITPLKRFISQFNNVMIILLLVVGVLSLIYSSVTKTDYTDAIVILFSVIVNAIMGYIQEKKAEDSLESLKSYVTSTVEVIREGKSYEVDSKELVKGDIIILESGDKIPADCRIIDSINASVDESVLTGESISVTKSEEVLSSEKPLHERSNMLYSGTILVNGKVTAIVVETGNNTEFGKIAKNLLREKEAPTTLEVKVAKVSKLITFLAAFLVALVIVYGIVMKNDILTIVMLCISMIVASVPECLPIAITATLSVGANQMAKKKAIVKRLSAIETLGATEIICSDKTGTLTTNEMTVVRVLEGTKIKLNIREEIKKRSSLVNIIGLCNNASENPDKKDEFFGDSVEVAFIKYLKTIGVDKNILEGKYKRLGEIPFDSNRKMMSTVNNVNGKNFILTKGSLSSVLKLCNKYEENGKIKKLTSLVKKSIQKHEKQMSNDALKVIALAYKPYLKDDFDITEKDENNLIFVGLVGLIDPPRSDVTSAIDKCKSAGVTPIMITGDSLETALSIAKEIGIATNNKEGILGEEIRTLTDKELAKVLKTVKVFARVTPEDKVRIVTFLQKTGKVIAMTGDGVNDAPAIKLANVGVGMGKTGSDVTKGAADIILMDDSFSTIVTAIEEGRRIYDNVINNILYNLSSNFTEIIIILVGMFTFKNIISPIHVLYIDLVADTLPSICLAFEMGSKNLMKRKPASLNQNIFTPYFKAFLSLSVVIEVAISLFVFYIFNSRFGLEVGQTMALLSIVLNEFVFVYNCRSLDELIIKRGIFSNKYLNVGMLILIGVQLLVFLTPIGSFFGLVRISFLDFIIILLINIIGFILIELLKPLLTKLFKKEN
ncbi:MAG: cation-translocating P-type ATPase [Bacilli bacterium]